MDGGMDASKPRKAEKLGDTKDLSDLLKLGIALVLVRIQTPSLDSETQEIVSADFLRQLRIHVIGTKSIRICSWSRGSSRHPLLCLLPAGAIAQQLDKWMNGWMNGKMGDSECSQTFRKLFC